nr:SRPBCC family protein [Streptomyces sp. NBC_00974]
MSKVEASIEVDVPVRTAYNQWTQFESFPHFMDGVERIEQRTDTMTHWVTKIGSVTKEFEAEITEQIPDEWVAWTTLGGEVKHAGVVTFHRLAKRRKITAALCHQGLRSAAGFPGRPADRAVAGPCTVGRHQEGPRASKAGRLLVSPGARRW